MCLGDGETRNRKVNLTERVIVQLQNDLGVLREKQSAETPFRSRANWYEF